MRDRRIITVPDICSCNITASAMPVLAGMLLPSTRHTPMVQLPLRLDGQLQALASPAFDIMSSALSPVWVYHVPDCPAHATR
jgi:hypothetical protein